MKVAVIGANGQLGTDICRVYRKNNHEVIELLEHDFNVVNYDQCEKKLKQVKPDLVVNTAAMHHVDSCEEKPEEAFLVNGIGARNIALISKRLGASSVYVSTDYVFDGRKKAPYTEEDYPVPLNVYGNTKLSAEMFVRSICDKYFVVRVSGLYGLASCIGKKGVNFVKLMLKLAKERDEVRVVDDEFLTPTYTRDIADQLEKLTKTTHYGLYHMTAQGSCSWYKFTAKIFELAGVKTKLSVADPSEFPAKTPRPKYSVLENAKLEALNLNCMPDWEDGLGRYLTELKKTGEL